MTRRYVSAVAGCPVRITGTQKLRVHLSLYSNQIKRELTGAGGKSNSKSEVFLLSRSGPASGTLLRPAYIIIHVVNLI